MTLTDLDFLPEQYHSIVQPQPYYPGDGQLSVNQLQELCNKFAEHTHQQAVIKQNMLTKIEELSSKTDLPILNFF